MVRRIIPWCVVSCVAVALGGCALPADRSAPVSSAGEAAPEVEALPRAEPRAPRGEIVVAGRRFPVEAPVVLWTDPGGYDAYRETAFFARDPGEPARRFGVRSAAGERVAARVRSGGWTLGALRDGVDQVVIHYDAVGTARGCFRVLHDQRHLSAHFLIDLDGTIYQTLDVRERAWHATKANDRSVGVEIANIGAYPAGAASPLDAWYEPGDGWARVELPPELGDGGVRTAGFVARPARPGAVVGEVQGGAYRMYDFTDAQYRSLIALTTTLCRVFPGIRPEAPRGDDGRVLDRVMPDAAYERFGGVLGHLHVQANKIDPGPAFDWERVLGGVRANLRDEPAGVDAR